MPSEAHLTLVASEPVPPKRGRNNTNKGEKVPPDPVSAEEFALMLQQCVPLRTGREAEPSALRLRVLLVILYRTGLRISEALNVYEHDLKRD